MLRHTFCTNMYLAGVDILTAQHQMGHSDIKTTLSIYTHISENFAKDEMKKLDSFFEYTIKRRFLEEVFQDGCLFKGDIAVRLVYPAAFLVQLKILFENA